MKKIHTGCATCAAHQRILLGAGCATCAAHQRILLGAADPNQNTSQILRHFDCFFFFFDSRYTRWVKYKILTINQIFEFKVAVDDAAMWYTYARLRQVQY